MLGKRIYSLEGKQISLPVPPFMRSKPKTFPVKVCTLDSELQFDVENKVTGQELFFIVCRKIDLRETWYFGLQFEDEKGFTNWVKSDRKVRDQIDIKEVPVCFKLRVKFYPENVVEDLIQDVTQHLFFLQVKQSILKCDSYCPPEPAVLLASYVVQSKHGDYDESMYKSDENNVLLPIDELLPQRVVDQYETTHEEWQNKIKIWHCGHRGVFQDEAELEYLKIAQDLETFGVTYFPVNTKKGLDLWLGVSALGLNVYDKDNKLHPKASYPWAKIHHINFDKKTFVIKPILESAPNLVFFSPNPQILEDIFELSTGNRDLYMKRRKPDTAEVQQMKAQAKYKKTRRSRERRMIAREKQLRETAEKEKQVMEKKLTQYQEEAKMANEAFKRSEETADLLAEKARVAQEEAELLTLKAVELECEIAKMRIAALNTEQEKVLLERKAWEAEQLTARLVEDSERRAVETERIKAELCEAKMAEMEAKERLLEFLANF